MTLRCLCCFGRPKFGAEDLVPEATGDSEPVLVVGKVMLKVVLFQLSVIGRETVGCISLCKVLHGRTPTYVR